MGLQVLHGVMFNLETGEPSGTLTKTPLATYTTVVENRMRKAIAFLRRQQPDVIVTEFNFQSDFRDRTSSLESLLAVVQRLPDTRVVVLYDREYEPQFEKLRARLPVHAALAFPVSEDDLRGCLLGLDDDAGIDA